MVQEFFPGSGRQGDSRAVERLWTVSPGGHPSAKLL